MLQLPEQTGLSRWVALLDVLARLAAAPESPPLSFGAPPSYKRGEQGRIDAVVAHLERHFRDEVRHKDVARVADLDPASLCRFFKRTTGRTITTYVNERRVGEAGRLLAETDLSVLEVGLRVGFGNNANFHRQFQRLKGMSPGAFRRRHR
jgi:transcriptional regulator GlxA family with amidase domain